VARSPPRKLIAGAFVWLLGVLLLDPTRAMAEGSMVDGPMAEGSRAEEDVNSALLMYDTGTSAVRQAAEVAFANAQKGIWWANTVLSYRKQQPLFCPPDNSGVVPGAQVIEMLRQQINKEPVLGRAPYGLAILITLQKTFPCKEDSH
jgi:hypothetical protein